MSALRALRTLASVSRVARVPAVAARSSFQVYRLPTVTRAFSTSRLVRGEGETDLALSQKLAEEIKYEKENATPGEPEFVKKFKRSGVWSVEDKEGHDEIVLTRTFGNESIRVLFSIADVDSAEPEYEMEEEGSSGEDVPGTSFPIRCSITVSKPSQGALSIDCLAQDGNFVVDNISFYQDAALATELTAEADWKRRGLYIGPQFDHLDVSVQEEFEKFLQERGIAEELSLFIPEYAEYKEQKEYVRWLGSVKAFVDA